jgi:hypothetical protein
MKQSAMGAMLRLVAMPGFGELPPAEQDRRFEEVVRVELDRLSALAARFEARARRLLRESPWLSPEERMARWAEILPPLVNPSLQ